jgi:hypothetical protein
MEFDTREFIKLRMFRSSELMTALGVRDFGWQDLIKPEYERTRRSLSAIINFAKFRVERSEIKAMAEVRTEELKEQKSVLEEANQKYAEEYKALHAVRNTEKPKEMCVRFFHRHPEDRTLRSESLRRTGHSKTRSNSYRLRSRGTTCSKRNCGTRSTSSRMRTRSCLSARRSTVRFSPTHRTRSLRTPHAK